MTEEVKDQEQNQEKDQEQQQEQGVSRRNFLKIGGTVAAAVQVGAVAGVGLSAGKDPATHTGWQHLGDNTQFVDRVPLEIDGEPYEKVSTPLRPEDVESAFGRNKFIRQAMMASMAAGRVKKEQQEEAHGEQALQAQPAEKDDKSEKEKSGGPGAMPPGGPAKMKDQAAPPPKRRRGGPMKYPAMEHFPEPLLSFYKKNKNIYELDKIRMESIMPKKRRDMEKYGDYYTLIEAWSDSWGTNERISTPPEVSDFHLGDPGQGRARPIPEAVPFKSPKLASKLIKKVAHHFGATMVGITKLKPEWCYNHNLRGSDDQGPYEVPKHWEYVIAFGVPHQWEQVQSNPNCGTSFDAYSRTTIAARRLESFIKSLGYPARRHSPMDGYDLIGVPILVDAGLGQQGRHGIVITPETGSNFRSAFVTTSLPMKIDKPIDFGVDKFCKHCKICAEICPSGSISFDKDNKKMTTRGYRHWEINQTSCFNYWMQSMGGMGCRLCLIACPYSRKSNWAHALARKVDTKDPTGIVTRALTWMQKTFFRTPAAEDYLPPPDGHFATFREPPEWLKVEKYLDLKKVVDPTKGGKK